MARKGSGSGTRVEKVKEIYQTIFERMEMLNASRIQHLQHGFSSKWHQYASACNVQVHNSIQCANERYNGTFYLGLSKNWVWEIELLSPLLCVAVCVCARANVSACSWYLSVRPPVFVFWLWILSCTHHTTPHTQPQTKYNTLHTVLTFRFSKMDQS